MLGIEFQKGAPAQFLYNFVEIGSDSPLTFSALANHIIFDRDYFHGNPTQDLNRGLFVQADVGDIAGSAGYVQNIVVRNNLLEDLDGSKVGGGYGVSW